MNSPVRSTASSIIVIIETLLMFIMGILGNKASERFQIPTLALYTLIGIGLTVLSVISYIKIDKRSDTANTSPINFNLLNFIPKSMIGILPFGTLFGWIVGAVLTTTQFEHPGIIMPQSIAYFLQVPGIRVPWPEFWGLFIAFIIGLLIAILIDSRLAFAFIIGYAIAFPNALLLHPLPYWDLWLTYIGETIYFLIIGFLILIGGRRFKNLGKVLTEPRI